MNKPIEIVEIDWKPTIGISAPLTKSQNKNLTIISNLWKRFNAQMYKIENRPPSREHWEKFGITHAQKDEYHYTAAIPFADEMVAPSHMKRKEIAQGRYARFIHTGKMGDLKSTLHVIYKEILPRSNFKPESNGKAGLIHFERYDNRFHWNRSDSIIEIYVPVKPCGNLGIKGRSKTVNGEWV